MAENKVDETAALHKFRHKYRISEIIFEEGSTGGEMYLIHTLVTGQRPRIKRSSRLSKKSALLTLKQPVGSGQLHIPTIG